jgi:uncharacterized protein (DUF697 family)
MTNHDPQPLVDDVLAPDLEAILRKGFVDSPRDFDSRIVSQLPVITNQSLVAKIRLVCRCCVMTIGGALAATEVIAFVFSFWAASSAL